MTKGVKICLAAAVFIFISAVIAALIVNRPAESSWVEIVQEGKTLYTIDIANSEDREIRIDGENGGYNIVKIEGGKIFIYDADCPDKTCINTGVLRSEDVPIVCLPHRLIIRFTSQPQNGV